MLPVHEGTLSLDVWMEIIRQFRLGFRDIDSTRRTKITALRTLSLVSRQLHPLAQSEILRTVSGARHIAQYIVNAEGSNVVDNTPPKFLRRPLDSKCRERVLKLLSYTRTFSFKSSTSYDPYPDMEFVIMAIGRSSLFVNLDTIIMGLGACCRPDFITTFSMIVSSSIERIIYHRLVPEDQKFVLQLHTQLLVQNAPIKSVEVLEGYRIPPSFAPRLLYTAAPGISLDINSVIPLSRNSLQLWFLALSNSSNLIDLRIVFKPPGGHQLTPDFEWSEDDRIQFAKLQRLEVHAWDREDFLSYLDCPSLVSLSLCLMSTPALPTIFTSVARFARLESFSITLKEKSRVLKFEDLHPVIDSLTSLRDLTILGVISELTEDDIIKILITRPFMRTLVLSGPKSMTPLPFSIFFSLPNPQTCQLETLCLPVDLGEIVSLQNPSPAWPVMASLRRFIIWDPYRIPDPSMREMLKFAEFVYWVFPCARIETICAGERTYGGLRFVENLEELRSYMERGARGLLPLVE